LIQAKNNYRIAKNNLANLLGYNLPRDIWDNIPLKLIDTLDATPYQINLPDALQQALNNRPELLALRKTEELQRLNITERAVRLQAEPRAGFRRLQLVQRAIHRSARGFERQAWTAGTPGAQLQLGAFSTGC
jgi:hypothetical protein